MDRFYARWALPALGSLLLVVGIGALPATIRAAHHDGTWGTFTATDQQCFRLAGCVWNGTFVSDDATIAESEVTFDGGGVHAAGDQVRAEKVRGSADVYGRNTHAWAWSAAMTAAGVLALTWWLVASRRAARVSSG